MVTTQTELHGISRTPEKIYIGHGAQIKEILSQAQQ
jgi:hypothetical protein